jgi:hypothetical protein
VKNTIENFSNVVIKTNSAVNMYLSDKNSIYGNVNLNKYIIQNDTLYISDTTLIKIDFNNINSITSTYGSKLVIDSINTNNITINCSNNSNVRINKGLIKNISIFSDNSKIHLSNCKIYNIKAKIANKSFISFNSRIKSITIDSDTTSYFNANGWRENYN